MSESELLSKSLEYIKYLGISEDIYKNSLTQNLQQLSFLDLIEYDKNNQKYKRTPRGQYIHSQIAASYNHVIDIVRDEKE